MNLDGAGSGSFLDIGHLRQLVILDFEQFQRLLGDLRRVRQYRGHRIADIAHFVHGDDGLVFIGRAVFIIEALDVVARQRGDHSRQFFRSRGVDLDQFGVSHGTAQDARMGHAGQLDVAGVDRLAADFFDGVDAVRIGADDFQVMLGLHNGLQKRKGHGEFATVARAQRYLRILGLSFSGKYLSQKGQ